MEFIVKRDELLKALSHVQSVVEKRTTSPILSNVKIHADKGGTLELTTTDMDICIIDSIPAQVTKESTTTLPVLTLYDIIRKIPQNCDISFVRKNVDDNNLLITGGASEFTLPTLSAEEFPNFEEAKTSHNFKISSEILKALFTKTRHAVSNEETRYYLNGIYMHVTIAEDNTPVLRTIATDGHRLARAQTIQPEGAQDMPGIIIPKKTVAEIIKLLEDYAGEVNVSLSANKIVFNIGSSTLSSKLIDGKFPDYDRVIPKNNDKRFEVSRDELSRSIDLVISVSNDKTRAVKFNLEPSKVFISASSEMNGNAKGHQEINAKFDAKEALTIGFNSKYVLDSLSSIDGNNVTMTLSNSLGAVIAQDTNDNNFINILMPMQV